VTGGRNDPRRQTEQIEAVGRHYQLGARADTGAEGKAAAVVGQSRESGLRARPVDAV